MRKFWAAAAAAVFVCGVACAAEGPSPEHGDAAIGIGIICNTPQQAELFVSLRSKGAAADQAISAVNARAKDNRACGVAAIAYIRDQTVDTMKVENKLVQIVRISVFAGFNGSAWQRVAGMVQYAVLEGGGISV
ncbi:MAG TPA: hypothetical protein VKG24_13350 [Pseudolabrys sp.]|jgi:hypothetical protein|nr:hypothetical protein [Pseudolabrys sp.]